jgi:hypothetical protein
MTLSVQDIFLTMEDTSAVRWRRSKNQNKTQNYKIKKKKKENNGKVYWRRNLFKRNYCTDYTGCPSSSCQAVIYHIFPLTAGIAYRTFE